MEYHPQKKEITLDKELNKLDELVLDFVKVLEKYVDYVIISGYVSILLGRTRATEDIDLFIKKIPGKEFSKLYRELKEKGYWCINAESSEKIYHYLDTGHAVRFAKEGKVVPNFEVKFPKKEIDRGTFEDYIVVKTSAGKIKISSLERQIVFKKYFLKSKKDIEDALHVEELFKGKLDKEKIKKLKGKVKNI